MPAESIQQAWVNLEGPGRDLTEASFEIGWEVAHIADEWRPPLSEDKSVADPPPPTPRGVAEPLLATSDLSISDKILVRIARITASLCYFQGKVPGEIPQYLVSPPVPDITKVSDAIDANSGVDSALETFHTGMIMMCAALEGTTTASATNAGSPIHGLHEAYEVGRLLAAVVIQAGQAKSAEEFRQYVSIQNGGAVNQAQRAYSLIGSLRGSFAAAAAYAVARHLEDWSEWASAMSGPDQGRGRVHRRPRRAIIDNPPDRPLTDDTLGEAQQAILRQGRVWRAILSGQALATDYLVASSIADAANRLFVTWTTSVTAVARGFLRTALARFFMIIGALLLLIFVGAFLFDLLTQGGLSSGAKSGITIAAVIAAIGSAAGVFHVSRTQVTSMLSGIWALLEPPMLESEMAESIAMSTRRLPSDTVGGASPPQTIRQRLARARRGSLAAKSRQLPVTTAH
jgi:hypothetical protein